MAGLLKFHFQDLANNGDLLAFYAKLPGKGAPSRELPSLDIDCQKHNTPEFQAALEKLKKSEGLTDLEITALRKKLDEVLQHCSDFGHEVSGKKFFSPKSDQRNVTSQLEPEDAGNFYELLNVYHGTIDGLLNYVSPDVTVVSNQELAQLRADLAAANGKVTTLEGRPPPPSLITPATLGLLIGAPVVLTLIGVSIYTKVRFGVWWLGNIAGSEAARLQEIGHKVYTAAQNAVQPLLTKVEDAKTAAEGARASSSAAQTAAENAKAAAEGAKTSADSAKTVAEEARDSAAAAAGAAGKISNVVSTLPTTKAVQTGDASRQQDEIDRLSRELSDATAKLREAKRELTTKSDRISSLEAERTETVDKLARHTENEATLNARITALDSELGLARDEVESLTGKVAVLEPEVSALRTKISRHEEALGRIIGQLSPDAPPSDSDILLQNIEDGMLDQRIRDLIDTEKAVAGTHIQGDEKKKLELADLHRTRVVPVTEELLRQSVPVPESSELPAPIQRPETERAYYALEASYQLASSKLNEGATPADTVLQLIRARATVAKTLNVHAASLGKASTTVDSAAQNMDEMPLEEALALIDSLAPQAPSSVGLPPAPLTSTLGNEGFNSALDAAMAEAAATLAEDSSSVAGGSNEEKIQILTAALVTHSGFRPQIARALKALNGKASQSLMPGETPLSMADIDKLISLLRPKA